VERILFLTGKLAERGLERILEGMQPADFTYRVLNIGVNVAALMSAEMINRRLQGVDGDEAPPAPLLGPSAGLFMPVSAWNG